NRDIMKSLRPKIIGAAALFAVGVALLLVGPPATQAMEFKSPETLPGADLFTNGSVRRLRIEIAPAGIESLRRDPREFVQATVTEDGITYHDVGIHLKGSVGSFRPVDDKPDLTLDF